MNGDPCTEVDPRAWAAELGDQPEQLEARGLASRGARVFVEDGSAAVVSREHDLAALLGPPREGLAERLLAHPPGEVHVAARFGMDWCEALEADAPRSAAQFVRAPSAPAVLEELVSHEVAVLEGPGDEWLEALPPVLAREVRAIRPFPRSVVAVAGGAAASLAYAFVESPGWLDVSIDTVPDFRRGGFGTSAAAALALDGLRAGKGAVWGAEVDNRASLALAARLGFERIEDLALLRLHRATG